MMTTIDQRIAAAERTIADLLESRRDGEMSDGRYHSNGRYAAMSAKIHEARKALDDLRKEKDQSGNKNA